MKLHHVTTPQGLTSRLLQRPTIRIASVALVVTLVLVCFGVSPVAAQETSLKIAVVDIDRVVVMSARGKALQQRLQTLEQETQATLEAKAQTIKTLRDSAAGKTADEQRQLAKQIEDETLAGRRIREDAERSAQKIQDTELESIRQALTPVFETIQGESGYDLILNYNPALVISASEGVDITERVIQTLDAQ